MKRLITLLLIAAMPLSAQCDQRGDQRCGQTCGYGCEPCPPFCDIGCDQTTCCFSNIAWLAAAAGLGAAAGVLGGYARRHRDNGPPGPTGPEGQTGEMGTAGPEFAYPLSSPAVSIDFRFIGEAGATLNNIWFGQVTQPDQTVHTTPLIRSEAAPAEEFIITIDSPAQVGAYPIDWQVPFVFTVNEPVGIVAITVTNTGSGMTTTTTYAPTVPNAFLDNETLSNLFVYTNDMAPPS